MAKKAAVSAKKKSVPAKKSSVSAKKSSVSAVKKAVPAVKKAVKVPQSEIDKERKAVEARGFIVERIYVTSHGRRPRRLKSEKGHRMLVGYMRPDGLFVDAVVDVPPPKRLNKYGIWRRAHPEGILTIVDKKLAAKLNKQLAEVGDE